MQGSTSLARVCGHKDIIVCGSEGAGVNMCECGCMGVAV